MAASRKLPECQVKQSFDNEIIQIAKSECRGTVPTEPSAGFPDRPGQAVLLVRKGNKGKLRSVSFAVDLKSVATLREKQFFSILFETLNFKDFGLKICL